MRILERDEVLAAQSIGCFTVLNCNLTDEDLENLRANSAVFEGVDLTRANLGGVRWRHCTIKSVTLDSSNASSSVMRLCTFDCVTAKLTNFSQAVIENCEAHACDFSSADFEGASLTDSDFDRSSFCGADLTDADASYTNMRGVDFNRAILINANFSDADLRGADFTGARLDNTNFKGADIRGAIFDPGVMDEEQEEIPEFSPQMQELVDVAGPFVASIIKQGVDKNLIPSEEQEKLMVQLEGLVNVSADNKTSHTDSNDIVELLLKRAGDAGIGNLLEALHDEKDAPSEAVADLINHLAQDFNLNESATTEDLMEKIVKSIK